MTDKKREVSRIEVLPDRASGPGRWLVKFIRNAPWTTTEVQRGSLLHEAQEYAKRAAGFHGCPLVDRSYAFPDFNL